MKLTRSTMRVAAAACLAGALASGATAGGKGGAAPRATTANGVVEGTTGEATGVRAFRGIPFAAPPVGDLRWKPPAAVKSWTGVRPAAQFGPRCMQHPVFGDMNFRSNGMSEDCLYLNVWTPAGAEKKKLPVLLYFYGGGFVAGDGSEPRYDGESMARRGIVVVTCNYRLGVFGFLSHPELTAESPAHASGNYGFLDQNAALRWVRENAAAFGGDPSKITIAGESAGSLSVSGHMASPLSRDLISGAIGESGALLGSLRAVPLAQAEQAGAQWATGAGATSLAALRAMSADQVMEATKSAQVGRFPLTVDGLFLTEPAAATFQAGKQSRVPLLVGWNSEEMTWRFLLQGQEPTPENYEKAVRRVYGANADAILKLYPGATQEQAISSATDLAGDGFIAFGTWKWSDMHAKTGGKPVYRYLYARPRPAMTPEFAGAAPGLAGGVSRTPNSGAVTMPPATGAVHSAEIEYAMGNLSTNKVYAWTPDDYKVSDVMQGYFANFVKTGDPNGKGLPPWPAIKGDVVNVMRIDVKSVAAPDTTRDRYLLLDRIASEPKP